MWDYRARRSDKPGRNDDGDTVLMIVDLGMGVHHETPIRLTGCFAPERSQMGGRESARFLNEVLDEIEERARARGRRWPFVVMTEQNRMAEPDERRSFVRFVGEIFAFDSMPNMDSVNAEVATFLASHPEFGGGIGGDEIRP
jgi:hypothetical protein